jgi:hypothetical protein
MTKNTSIEALECATAWFATLGGLIVNEAFERGNIMHSDAVQQNYHQH